MNTIADLKNKFNNAEVEELDKSYLDKKVDKVVLKALKKKRDVIDVKYSFGDEYTDYKEELIDVLKNKGMAVFANENNCFCCLENDDESKKKVIRLLREDLLIDVPYVLLCVLIVTSLVERLSEAEGFYLYIFVALLVINVVLAGAIVVKSINRFKLVRL